MINNFKKHIDKLIKNRLDSGSVDFCLAESKKSGDRFNYLSWFTAITTQKIEKIHPSSDFHKDLVSLLSFSIFYKQSFKRLCDMDHPVVAECLETLNITGDLAFLIIDNVKVFDDLLIDYCDVFEKELADNNDPLRAVHDKITDLSKDSGQSVIVSHPAKMSHPDCRFPKIMCEAQSTSDGFVRTGNLNVDFDSHVNAAKLKVFKFISLKYNNLSVYEMILNGDVSSMVNIFSASEEQALLWVNAFRENIGKQDFRTSYLVKQVYFPFEGDYHQLSILTASGIVFELKNRIEYVNKFSRESYLGKRARKNNEHLSFSYKSIVGLTETKCGGDHPKNISGLNNKNQSYYLLSSLPPSFQHRDIQFPRRDFFSQSVRYVHCKAVFQALHKLYKSSGNNSPLRDQRDAYYQQVVDYIIEKMWQMRAVAPKQYYRPSSQLSAAQTLWLCEDHNGLRESTDDWLVPVCYSITQFIFHGYEKILGKQAEQLGDEEYRNIQTIVDHNKEALR